jgi:hypothetical protein
VQSLIVRSSTAICFEMFNFDRNFLKTDYCFKPLLGSRCTQLPLIEKLIQWLSGPSPSLSVATDRPRDTGPDSNDVRTRSIYSTNSVDDMNAKAVEA